MMLIKIFSAESDRRRHNKRSLHLLSDKDKEPEVEWKLLFQLEELPGGSNGGTLVTRRRMKKDQNPPASLHLDMKSAKTRNRKIQFGKSDDQRAWLAEEEKGLLKML